MAERLKLSIGSDMVSLVGLHERAVYAIFGEGNDVREVACLRTVSQ